jgi:hypothetical protein
MFLYPNRAVLELSGPDTIALLERTVTHRTSDWPVGEWRHGALLTPQGKIIADYLIVRTEDGVILDVPAVLLDDLARRFTLFRLRAAVTISPRAELGVSVDDAAPDPRTDELPGRRIAPRSDASDWTDYDAARIKAGLAEGGTDFAAAEVFPTDVNMDLTGGVDYRKGCFVGQEVASRMKRKGGVRKRTLVIQGAGLRPGDVLSAAIPLGEVTSAMGPLALARVRIDRLAKAEAAGETLHVNGAPVSIRHPDWLREEMKEAPADAAKD